MKVFVPCRHTLGDVLSAYFCATNYGLPNPKAELFGRLRHACRAGACSSAFVLSEFAFWTDLDFELRHPPHRDFTVDVSDNGWCLDELETHANLLRQPPSDLLAFPATPAVALPVRKPSRDLPKEYILFTDGAGGEDRNLCDPAVIDWLQAYLPVIRIGSSKRHWRLPMAERGTSRAALDLCDRTALVEVFWLAKHAKLIVSPCTYLRTMSAIYGTPVLELMQADRVQAATVTRTIGEYAGLEYGMRPGTKNAWCFWSGRPSAETEDRVEQMLSKTGEGH